MNPFSGPFGGAPGIGGNPLDGEENLVVCCPQCKSTNFRAWSGDYGLQRECNDCKQVWSGGTLAAAQPDFSSLRPDGTLAEDFDIPVSQYTGASFRDPSRTFGGDDDW